MVDRVNIKAYLESSQNFALEKLNKIENNINIKYFYYHLLPNAQLSDPSLRYLWENVVSLVILVQILKTFFIVYLQFQGILNIAVKFSKLRYWRSYYTFKDILC